MSRVINPNSPGKERLQLLKAVQSALNAWNENSKIKVENYWDLAAFITLSLEAIIRTTEATATAWEKRGYWVKAEQFRREWLWTEFIAKELRSNVINKNRNNLEINIAQVNEAVNDVLNVSTRALRGDPWKGAYQKLIEKSGLRS